MPIILDSRDMEEREATLITSNAWDLHDLLFSLITPTAVAL